MLLGSSSHKLPMSCFLAFMAFCMPFAHASILVREVITVTIGIPLRLVQTLVWGSRLWTPTPCVKKVSHQKVLHEIVLPAAI